MKKGVLMSQFLLLFVFLSTFVQASGYLPSELYKQIGFFLNSQDKNNVTLVGKQWNILVHQLTSYISVYARNDGENSFASIPLFREWISSMPSLNHLLWRDRDKITDDHLAELTKLRTLCLYLNCGQKMSGAGLCYLERLRYLSLSCMHDDAKICLSFLSNLHELNLNDSDWSGYKLEQLTNLRYLSLRLCPNVRNADIGRLTFLTSLSFCGVSAIRDDDLKYFSNLLHLEQLRLSNCSQLTNDGIKHLSELTRLYLLSLYAVDYINDLSVLSSIQTLILRECTTHNLLNNPPGNINQLHLEYCIGSPDVKGISKMTNLKSLLLRDGIYQISCHALSCLTSLTSIEFFHQNHTETDFVDSMSKLINLKLLKLYQVDELNDLSCLSRLSRLQVLYMMSNSSIRHLNGLSNLQSLQDLYLIGIGKIKNLQGVSDLSNLRFLCIQSCCRLTTLKGLKGLPQLNQLSLKDCSALIHVEKLRDLPKLEILYWRNCGKSKSELSNFFALSKNIKK